MQVTNLLGSIVRDRTPAVIAALGGLALMAGTPVQAKPQVIELTQVACQFLESENGVDHGFETSEKADCEAINARNAEQRLEEAKTLVLEPGEYTFRVTNVDVPYTLGFWLRGDGILNRATLPSVSGGGLEPGETHDYSVELEPGEYVYSCPLNPTPDYKLVVRES